MTEAQRALKNQRRRVANLTPQKRDELNRKQREYYAAHREHKRAQNRAYVAALSQEEKDSRREYGKRWRAENQEKIRQNKARWSEERRDHKRAKSREWYQNNRARALELAMKRRQASRGGHTPQSKREALKQQEFLCAICADDLRERPERHIHGDHCHKTGKPRGVLCHHCNTALGLFDDDIGKIRGALDYLEKHRASD